MKFLNNQYENLPTELRSANRFCCWRYEKVNGKIQKIPYNPVTGKRARPNHPDTFKDFHSALAAVNDYDGFGFLVGSGICGIDLDYCLDDAGELKTVAQSVVYAFSDCYMVLQGQIGFAGQERIDGKLIQPDAVSILQMKA